MQECVAALASASDTARGEGQARKGSGHGGFNPVINAAQSGEGWGIEGWILSLNPDKIRALLDSPSSVAGQLKERGIDVSECRDERVSFCRAVLFTMGFHMDIQVQKLALGLVMYCSACPIQSAALQEHVKLQLSKNSGSLQVARGAIVIATLLSFIFPLERAFNVWEMLGGEFLNSLEELAIETLLTWMELVSLIYRNRGSGQTHRNAIQTYISSDRIELCRRNKRIVNQMTHALASINNDKGEWSIQKRPWSLSFLDSTQSTMHLDLMKVIYSERALCGGSESKQAQTETGKLFSKIMITLGLWPGEYLPNEGDPANSELLVAVARVMARLQHKERLDTVSHLPFECDCRAKPVLS